MTTITFTKEALEATTSEQKATLVRLAEREQYGTIAAYAASPFDLPAGYLAVRFDYGDGSGSIYGGISPEGDLST